MLACKVTSEQLKAPRASVPPFTDSGKDSQQIPIDETLDVKSSSIQMDSSPFLKNENSLLKS